MSPNFPSELEGPVQPDELFGYGNLINLICGWTENVHKMEICCQNSRVVVRVVG